MRQLAEPILGSAVSSSPTLLQNFIEMDAPNSAYRMSTYACLLEPTATYRSASTTSIFDDSAEMLETGAFLGQWLGYMQDLNSTAW